MKLLLEIADKLKTSTSLVQLSKDIVKLYKLEGSTENWRKFLSLFRQILDRDDSDDNELSLTNFSTNQDGNWSVKYGVRRSDDFEFDDSFEVIGGTENVYGGKWIKYKKRGISSHNIKSVLEEISFDRFKQPIVALKNPVGVTKMYNITDVHIGMSADGSLYDYDWNISELYKRLDIFIENVDTSNEIIINQLGDYTDGMRSKTARMGHTLQQNLNDKEIFSEGIKAFIYVLNSLHKSRQKIVLNWLTNSNHPYVADYTIGVALKEIAKERWSNVTVNIMEDFISCVEYNNHTFALTHGYDEIFMKKGFPLILVSEHKNRLMKFFRIKGLNYPILVRGDRHEYLDRDHEFFRDIVTPAFSPNSGWVSTNFMGNNKGGFTIFSLGDTIETKLIKFK